MLGLLSFAAWSATPVGTEVTNTATASYQISGTPVTSRGSASVSTAARTRAVIEFLNYAPAGTPSGIMPTQCSTTGSSVGPFVPADAPALLPLQGGSTLAVPGTYNLVPASLFAHGEPVFVRVTDYDQNLDPLVAESIIVTLSLAGSEVETLQLGETGVSSGVFVGYIQSNNAAPEANDCQLSLAPGQTVTAIYTDPLDGSDSATAAALVDPYGMVFDATTGAAVNGATVTLFDVVANAPASVWGDDGVSTFPASVTSGGNAVDNGGTAYAFPPGAYRFPLVAPGTYRLVVTPPAGYRFPVTVPTPTLQALPGAPFAIVTGSRGENFVVNPGPALNIDLPLAPDGDLQITKAAGKAVVGEGEFVPYTLTLRNNMATPATGVLIADRLPQGFRYQPGSARLNGAALANPVISADGRSLTFSLGSLAPNIIAALRYVAEVTIAARPGQAENIATVAGGFTSNTARATVTVREDLMRSKAILMGRVIIGSCDDRVGNDEEGLPRARIVLQDGTYILTDEHGRWHADNIRPGTHVVQLDLDSLPPDYEVRACENNSRFAGRAYSQFVNVRGGSLWRADFHVQKKVPAAFKLSQQLVARREGERITVTLALAGQASVNSVSATLMLPEGATLRPDSVRLNGAATDRLEIADGMAILRLDAQAGGWRSALTFDLALPAADDARLVSMVRFEPPGQPGINLPTAETRLDGVATESSGPIPPAAPQLETPALPGTQDQGRAISRDGVLQAQASDDRTRLVEQLPYDADWLATAQPGTEWLHPQSGFQPAIPAIKLAVKHLPGQQIKLMLNGEAVDAVKFDGAAFNAARSVGLSTWRGVNLKPGSNDIEVVVTGTGGNVVLRETRRIHYAGGPAQAFFDAGHSRLVADGKTRPVVAVRFLDQDGQPARRGVTGVFQLNAPYQSSSQIDAIQRDPLAGSLDNAARYEIGRDGMALIELAPTTQSGEAVLGFRFNDDRRQELRAWLEPGQRDWILVGFAEGTLGHKKLSGNLAALKESGLDDALFDRDRIAFYAKGTVSGDTLLTLAYDTAKQRGDAGATANLKQAIDPNRYYTLYADATQPYFDAASSRKLYLKIERRQFYALFGDYDTGLTVTEFSRYSRTVNGLKSEFKNEHFAYNAFATLTAQAYVKDELAGNGTSGLYRLSRTDILENSDKLRIETRDRFQSQNILGSRTLTRFIDYDIDYRQGTVFFKSPVPSRDAGFNPVYIVAEYESASSRDEKLTAGGRAAYKPNAKTEVGATLIREGNVGAQGSLGGMDLTYLLSEQTRILAEFARSDRDLAGIQADGDAWKVEALHHGDKLDAKVYLRRQDPGFGLGQQAGSETGTRKFGADGRLKLTDTLQLQGQAYRQDTLVTGATRDVVEARVDQKLGQSLTGYYGARLSRDEDGAGVTRDSKQALAGVGYDLMDRRLTLRAATEVGFGAADSIDFPNRLLLGADYKLTEQTKLFAEQEFARGESLSANMTRVGLRVAPWTGGEMAASLGNQTSLDSGRLHADLGLTQKWQVNEFWQADFAIDRSQTLKATATPLDLNVPLASGSLAVGEYTAVSVGTHYNNTVWSSNTRIEWRDGDSDDRVNFLVGAQRNLDAGRVLAGGFSYTDTQSATSQSRKLDARLSYAHRPLDSEWAWLNRLDYIDELIADATTSSHAKKLVDNTHLNWMPNRRTQIALQYGAKYVFDRIDGSDYSGFTDLIGAEIRRDLDRDWDIGAHASVLHSWNSPVKQQSLGASLGYKLMDNMWGAVGYNFSGFDDADFSGADTRVRGAYIALRMKVDQDTLKLNDRKGRVFSTRQQSTP
jgi:uncharacterized repeat protein (TIGR01451 family)